MTVTPNLNEGVRGFLEMERAFALSHRHRDDGGYTIGLRTENLINSYASAFWGWTRGYRWINSRRYVSEGWVLKIIL
jgi:hypothetical protein